MRKYIIIFSLVFTFIIVSCEEKVYPSNEIPLTTYRNLYFIDLEINKTKARFLLDTGANSSYINYNDLSKFNLSIKRYDTGINLTGIGGTGGTVSELQYFRLQKRNGVVLPDNIVFKTTKLSGINLRIDGILGGDYLKANKAVINYRDNTLILN